MNDPEQPDWFNALNPEHQERARDLMKQMLGGEGSPYVFHRAEGWYPLTLKSDEEAIANAQCNPGTLSVENVLTRAIVWREEAI